MPKRWSWSTGEYGSTVRVRETKVGGNVSLHFYDPHKGYARRKSLGFAVRNGDGELIKSRIPNAKQKARRLSDALLNGKSPELTLGRAIQLCEREVIPEQCDAHAEDTRRALDFLRSYLGSAFVVSKLGPREWNDMLRKRLSGELDARGNRRENPKKRRPVGPRTAAKTMKVLRHLCRFSTRYRHPDGSFLLQVDPTRGLVLPSGEKKQPPICDDDRFEKLLAVADQVRLGRGNAERSSLRELLILGADTGRRIGAIVQLRWSDWFPDEGTHGVLRWRADSDKIGKEWKTPVTPRVNATLEAFRQERPAIGDAWVFPAPKGEGHLRVDVTRKWLLRAEELAELDHPHGFGWHSLRRMWATKRKHLPITDVAAAGGWKETETLQRLYQRPDMETMEQVVLNERGLRAKGS